MLDLSGVPRDYWQLKEVFSKEKAQILPPHRELDCAINLPPGATPARGRPGSENTKPDALSRQWAPLGPDPSSEPIIPAPQILAPLHWELETAIWEALRQEPVPAAMCNGCCYGRPGVTRTLDFVQVILVA
ncbi:hypothetical protein AOLI_G00101210 [Acnodon oligacanthus]